jgi:hypothetical protein
MRNRAEEELQNSLKEQNCRTTTEQRRIAEQTEEEKNCRTDRGREELQNS